MAKRMVDTDLWNNEQIVEDFTSDDKYFWLYLLTSPHGNICGVMKYSPALIGRDMGFHKDTIENLIYRFEHNYNLIIVDKDTKEIMILNWYKFNWNRSEKLITSILNCLDNVKSEQIRNLLIERINIVTENKKEDTVPIGYPYPPNSITNTITNNSNIVSIEKINEYFEKTYLLYPKKVSKEQARITYEHKFRKLEIEDARNRANYIYRCLERQIEAWKSEKGNEGRNADYMPYMSTWLNDNFQDSPHFKRGKKK